MAVGMPCQGSSGAGTGQRRPGPRDRLRRDRLPAPRCAMFAPAPGAAERAYGDQPEEGNGDPDLDGVREAAVLRAPWRSGDNPDMAEDERDGAVVVQGLGEKRKTRTRQGLPTAERGTTGCRAARFAGGARWRRCDANATLCRLWHSRARRGCGRGPGDIAFVPGEGSAPDGAHRTRWLGLASRARRVDLPMPNQGAAACQTPLTPSPVLSPGFWSFAQ
jgi:hypothetical protein